MCWQIEKWEKLKCIEGEINRKDKTPWKKEKGGKKKGRRKGWEKEKGGKWGEKERGEREKEKEEKRYSDMRRWG